MPKNSALSFTSAVYWTLMPVFFSKASMVGKVVTLRPFFLTSSSSM